MVQIAGTYQLVKNENLVEYLVGSGLDAERAKKVDSLKPKLQVAVDGNKITLTSDSRVTNTTVTFILGQEVDEVMPDNITLKSVAKLDGDTLTVTSKAPTGKTGTRTYKFSDKELVVTMASQETSVVGKRFYNKV